jgi:phenylacetate-coenzyme A ligase PaaK-like adenylate-forming protein
MLPFPLTQRLSGLVAGLIVYPIAERVERRDIRRKQRRLAAAMARPYRERRIAAARALAEAVGWAGRNVPYYEALFQRLRFDAQKLADEPHRLEELPYLTKDIVRAEGERLFRRDHASFRKHLCKTGGSTGPATDFYYDQEAADWSSAVTRHARASIGKHHFMSELHFASRFPEKFPLRDRLKEAVKCFAMNRSNIFFADFEPASLDAIWRQLKRARPHLAHGHPSTMAQVAQYVRDRDGSGRACAVFESSGEMMSAQQRRLIAEVLGCRVINRYGLSEFGIVAYQTEPADPAMLLYDAVAWPEVAPLDDADEFIEPAKRQGEAGELVLTGLLNRLMPLIRYRTGDVADLGERADGRYIFDIVGRIHDVVRIGGRRYATHYIQDALDRIGGIRDFQIEVGGAVPVLRLIPEPDADRHVIRTRVASWWADDMAVEFIAPADLKLRGPRAKFRYVVPAEAATLEPGALVP